MDRATEKLWNKPYILLSVTNFFSWLSYNMITPVLTGYMGTLGASVSICGIVGGLFAFTSLFSRPVSGVLADRKNRKYLMSIFTLVMTVSLLIYSLIPSIPVIILFRGIHGIAFGISSTASLVLVSESVSEKRMGEAISYYGLMSVASMTIGPSLGIVVSEKAGYQACMLTGTAMLAIAAITAMLYPYTPPKNYGNREAAGKNALVEKSLLGLSGINASFTMMNGVVSTFLVVFAAERGIEGVSWHFTLNAVFLILTRVVLAKHMNTWPLRKNLYPAFVCGVATMLLIGKAGSLAILLAAAFTKAIAAGMSQPALQTEAFRSVPPEKRGVASSTMYIGGDLGQAVGPILGGMIAEYTGYGIMYLLCALPIAAAWIYFVQSERKKKYRQ